MNIAKFFQPDPDQPAVPTDHVALPPLDVQALTAAEAVAPITNTTPNSSTLAAVQAAPAIEETAVIDEPESVPLAIVEDPIAAAPIKQSDEITLNVSDAAHQTEEIVQIIPHDS